MSNPCESAEQYAAYLDSLIPDDYQDREGYQLCLVTKMISATVRPPTGVCILDLVGPGRTADIVATMTQAQLQAMGERESRLGDGHDVRMTRRFKKYFFSHCKA